MSGGSFNYLCHVDGVELFNRKHDIEDMLKALNSAPIDCEKAYRDTAYILTRLEQIAVELDGIVDKLRPVWKAVEWERSGDWSENAVELALQEYESKS